MRVLLAFSLFINLTSVAPCQTVTLRLDSASSQIRMGEPLNLDCWVDNPQAAVLAGYQAFFSFSADSFELLAAPSPLFGSVLTDVWAFNCPPPFGSGWASCPEAGDGIAEEGVFAIGAALSSGSYSSAATAHLFRTTFEAGQALGSAPSPFLLDDPALAGCIGNAISMVADSSANPLTVVLESTEVVVTPNLEVSGSFYPGGALAFEVRDDPGLPWHLFASLQIDAADYGAMGVLYVDIGHPSFRFLGQGVLDGTGVATQAVVIPALAGLSGQTAYCQAATGLGAPVASRRLTNLTAFVIQ